MEQVYITSQKKAVLTICIYTILTLAIFSDVLRVGNSSVTLFRISIPLALGIISLYPRYVKELLILVGVFWFVNTTQYIVFFKIYKPHLQFSLELYLKQMILFVCIVLLFFLVRIIRDIQGEYFEKHFMNYIIAMGGILAAIILVYNVNSVFLGNSTIDNPNNYGCYMCALVAVLLVKYHQEKKWYWFVTIFSVMILAYISDSKAALFGIFLEIFIWICIGGNKKETYCLGLRRYILPLFFIGLVVLLLIVNPSIHSYPLRGIVLEPITRILEGEPYINYTSSVKYRTNTTIFALQQVKETYGFGVGIGNTGILLKEAFPNLNPAYVMASQSPALSLHNAWLEFMLDEGIVGILLIGTIFGKAVKKYFSKVELSALNRLFVIFAISFPIWIISASGIHTLYYLFITMAYMLFAMSQKNHQKLE